MGTINGQDGWSSTGPYDHEVDTSNRIATFGAQSLRLSNAVTSGAFGDQTFSRSLVDEAGETSAEGGGMSGGTRQNSFEAVWSFASTVPTGEQSGLSVVASPDRGDGARMSWVQMTDTPTVLDVNFNDYQTGTGFVLTNVATGLSRAATHTIKLTMIFVDGPVNVPRTTSSRSAWTETFCHTGTSWEDYFRDVEVEADADRGLSPLRTSVPAPDTIGKGFMVDNVTMTSSGSPTACVFTTTPTTMTLVNDCTTDHTITVPHGVTLDGDDHSITAVDPVGGHFLGAVVKNGGTVAHVTDVEITRRPGSRTTSATVATPACAGFSSTTRPDRSRT